MQYNTQREKLRLPEYGRHVQQMVNYCMSISDREERTRCAHDIVRIMQNLFPRLAQSADKNDAWDTLNMLSGFKLDIDWPCEVASEEKILAKPEPIPYSHDRIRFRHYGIIIEKMIDAVDKMEPDAEKENLVFLIASHMKKLMLQHNREAADDMKIFRDLEIYSSGHIHLSPENCVLADFYEEDADPQQHPQKKRKNQKRKKQNNYKK